MKKALTLIITLLSFITISNGQTSDSVSSVKVDSSLWKMTKMQLTDLYLDEVTKLAFSSPYTPFTIGVTDTINGDLDIPVSRYIAKKREKILEMSKAYGDTMKTKLYELVPYSDKKDIIHAILFLREVNGEIKK
jgi:hypothetical protein